MAFYAFREDDQQAQVAKDGRDISLRDWTSDAYTGATNAIAARDSEQARQENEWRAQYGEVRAKLINNLELMKQYLELPIQVRHSYDGYPAVDAALLQLESGWWLDACLLADCTYTDDRVAACLNTRTNAPFALEMEFKYQGEDEEADDDEDIVALKKGIRDIVKEFWDEMLPLSGMREWFRWGILVNLGVGELVWDYHPMQMRFDDSPHLSQMDELFIPILKTWNPQTCYWRWDTRSLWIVHQAGQTELHPGDGRWVTYSPQGHNHGWLYGAIRQLGKLWLDRIFTYRDWARAEEKYSLGIIKAFEPAGASPADKQRFEDQVTQMPPEATITLPRLPGDGKEFDLEMMETQQVGGGWEIFERRADNLNRNIAILLLGQNLTTESQQGMGGGGGQNQRGNAKVQDSVRKDYMKADTKSLEHAIKTQVLAPFVERNFAWAASELGIHWRELVPNVRYQVEPPQDKSIDARAAADAASALASLKTAMAPVDDVAFMEKHDIPAISSERSDSPPNIGDSNERPRAPNIVPGADPDPRPVLTSRLLLAGRREPPPGLRSSSKEGQLYVDHIRQVASEKAAHLLTRHREKVLEICRARSSYKDKRTALASLFKVSDPTELRRLVRHAIVASRMAGRLSVHLGRR